MEDKVFLKNKNAFVILVFLITLLVLIAANQIYSINKFNLISSHSIVKSNVVMRIIQHNVKSVCPRCAFKGVPACPKCNVNMYWNGYRGTFLCPSCGEGGFPTCPKCSEFMTWIESR